VIGASGRQHSVGATVLRNVLSAPFSGQVYAVNPKYDTLSGIPVYPTVAALPATPDLGNICTRAPTVPSLIRELGERGTKAAIILSAGLGTTVGPDGVSMKQAALETSATRSTASPRRSVPVQAAMSLPTNYVIIREG